MADWIDTPDRASGDVITEPIWDQDVGTNVKAIYENAVPSATVNSFFDVWQRNTSFTPTANTKTYTADRWYVNIGTGGVATISRQAHTPGAPLGAGKREPPYMLRWNQTTGGTGTLVLAQPIEHARTRAGEKVTLVLIAKVSSGTLAVTPKLVQKFGTGGSPSSDVTLAGTAKTITTSFAQYTEAFTLGSVSGKTFGSNGDDSLELRLELPTSTTFTLDVGLVALMPGTSTTGTVIVPRLPYEIELYRCRRFYTSLAYADVVITIGFYSGAAVQQDSYWTFLLPVQMRSAPTGSINGTWATTNINSYALATSAKDSFALRVRHEAANTATLFQMNSTDDTVIMDAEL